MWVVEWKSTKKSKEYSPETPDFWSFFTEEPNKREAKKTVQNLVLLRAVKARYSRKKKCG